MSRTVSVSTRMEAVEQVKALKMSAPTYYPLCEVAVHWLELAGALAVFYWVRSWWLYPLLLLFVSARQYALAILLHDGQHTLLYPVKSINNVLCIWLIGAPLGTEFLASRRTHLEHHLHLGDSVDDPDYALYCFGAPAPKRTVWQVVSSFLGRIFGGKIFAAIFAHPHPRHARAAARSASSFRQRVVSYVRRLWPIIVVQLTFLVLLTWLFGWYGYVALWFVPLTTLAIFYNDFRIFCEHSLVGRDSTSGSERIISYVSSPLERFFVAPNHMNYHAEHHMFPYVSHGTLPQVRPIITACPVLNAQVEWRRGYFEHFFAYLAACRRAN